MKKTYHKKQIHNKVYIITQLSKLLDIVSINRIADLFFNQESYHSIIYKKYPSSTIMKEYLFTVRSNVPTCITIKVSINLNSKAIYNLQNRVWQRVKFNPLPVPDFFITVLSKSNLSILIVADIEEELEQSTTKITDMSDEQLTLVIDILLPDTSTLLN